MNSQLYRVRTVNLDQPSLADDVDVVATCEADATVKALHRQFREKGWRRVHAIGTEMVVPIDVRDGVS